MFSMTLLSLWLVTGTPGTDNCVQDSCRKMVVNKIGDCDTKAACCETAAKDECRKILITTLGGAAAQALGCDPGARDACKQVCVAKAGTCEPDSACCATGAKDKCCKVIISTLGGRGVRSLCCEVGAKDARRTPCLTKPGTCAVKSGCCGVRAEDACCQMSHGKAGTCDTRRTRGATGLGACQPLIVACASAGGRGIGTACGANAVTLLSGDEGEKVIVRELKQLPDVWIGVRVTTLPEPLAAHLKRKGLMIANVAEDSPADHAGLERYDVVISFGGRAINEMDDLLDAVKETGADNTAVIVVIRGGDEESLTIKPVKRPDTGPPAFKYEEPESADVDRLEEYFGHRFKLGPGGLGLVLPHGRLDRLPDDIKDLLDDIPDIDWEEYSGQWPKLKGLPFEFDVDIDSDDFGGLPGFHSDDVDVDTKAQISIKICEDGETIAIHRSEDGTITVKRADADGNESSDTYDDVDQLREEDPDAYKVYRRCLGHRGHSAIFVTPDLENLGTHQREFQIELSRQLDKARDQVREALEEARKVREKVRTRIRTRVKGDDDHDAGEHTKSVKIVIDDEGRISLEIKEDGTSKKYEFDSREDFRNSAPELYKRYMEQGDETDSGTRNDRLELASAARIA